MKSKVDYYKDYNNVKIVCDYLIVNKNFDYELSKECMKCKREVICSKWIYKMNINSSCKVRSDKVIVKSNNELEKLKLNCESVRIGRKRSRIKNKELYRRIEDMKSNGEEIKELTM